MEEVKKEDENEKVKIYDKDMYINQEKIRTIIIIIVIFIIGFIAGYFSNHLMAVNENENENDIENTNIMQTEEIS